MSTRTIAALDDPGFKPSCAKIACEFKGFLSLYPMLKGVPARQISQTMRSYPQAKQRTALKSVREVVNK